jgi:predicted CoA-binding protein
MTPTPVDHERYDDGYIRGLLNTVKTIAMVGVSANTSRPSYFAFKYLLERGYRMIPVNPGLAGQDLLGQRVYARLGGCSSASATTRPPRAPRRTRSRSS